MRVRIVTPVPVHSRQGNRVTALRWAAILRGLGDRVSLEQEYGGAACDLLIALHAKKSFTPIHRFHELHPYKPLLVALTGTDVYRDIHADPEAVQALEWASRIIMLQPLAANQLPVHLRSKAVTIYQSVPPIKKPPPNRRSFDVCVIGHLRPVKDPFRAAEAARLLPSSSR